MGKRVVISLVAMLSLGSGAIWWTYAEAQNCLQYRTIGGSSMCTAWSTKGVQVEVKFKDECFVGGSEPFSICSAEATATTDDSIAFCRTTSGGVRRVACSGDRTFVPVSTTPCEPKHEQDETGEGGLGHRHHGCTQTITLAAECADCCIGTGLTGACADVTPVEMDTLVIATVPGGEGTVTTALGEHCSINPKKIALNEIRPYQCNQTCVGEACPPCIGDVCDID